MSERPIQRPDQIGWGVLAIQCVVERVGVNRAAKHLGWPAARLSRRMRDPKSLTLEELAQMAERFGCTVTLADPSEHMVGRLGQVRFGRPRKLTPRDGGGF